MTADLAAAINRVADALFTQAKAFKQSAKAQEESCEIQRELLCMQKANLAVTLQLEEALKRQSEAESDRRSTDAY